MTLRLSTGLRNAMANSVATALRFGEIDIYSGAQPASPDSPATGTLLGTVTIGTLGAAGTGLEFTAASGGVINKSGTWQFTGLANGTAGYFRFRGDAADANGTSTTLVRMDGSIGTAGAVMNMSSTTIATGAVTTIDQFSLTIPAA